MALFQVRHMGHYWPCLCVHSSLISNSWDKTQFLLKGPVGSQLEWGLGVDI